MTNAHRLAAALLLGLCAAPTRAQFTKQEHSAAAADPKRYTLDAGSIRVVDSGPAAATANDVAAPDDSAARSVASISEIVNIGLKTWKIVEDNRPVVDASHQFATALPKGVSSWTKMAHWSAPQGRVYELSAKNLYGQEVVRLRYQVLREFGGSLGGKGKYLTAVTVEPLAWDVKWGFHFRMEATVPESSIVNVGTAEEPVAGLLAQLFWRIDTPVKISSGESLYFLQGDGVYREVGSGARALDASSPLLEDLFRQELNPDQLRRLRGEGRLEDMAAVMNPAQRVDLRMRLELTKASSSDPSVLAEVARAERILDLLGAESLQARAARERLAAQDFNGATAHARVALENDPSDAAARFALESARGRSRGISSSAARLSPAANPRRYDTRVNGGDLPFKLPIKVRMASANVPTVTPPTRTRWPWAPLAAAAVLAAGAFAAAKASWRGSEAARMAVIIGVPLVALLLVVEAPVIVAATASAFEVAALPQVDAVLTETAEEAPSVVSGTNLPWTTWDSAQKTVEEGRLYARIGERLYTEHAVERMMPRGLSSLGRSVSPTNVEFVLRSGDKFSKIVDGVSRVIHRSGDVEVITEQADKIIVTVKRI